MLKTLLPFESPLPGNREACSTCPFSSIDACRYTSFSPLYQGSDSLVCTRVSVISNGRHTSVSAMEPNHRMLPFWNVL